jgi:hypothetical protein
LAELGCFFLRRGAIENYYGAPETADSGKPDRSAIEAAGFDAREADELVALYADARRLAACPAQ